ncbi:MAG TPA: FHA domain-containing protein [Bryobacteraceae bacterium]|nr:FHA domain-containing protein [Bryobacteraceae bacterium]
MVSFGLLTALLPGGQRQEFTLSKAEISVGRAATSDISLQDPKVSRSHTRIECGSDGCVVVDLGSANGTKVNGTPVQRAKLKSGDRITIGACTLCFQTGAPSDDLELTRIDTPAELDKTLALQTLHTLVHETRTPRLTVTTPRSTSEVTLDRDVLTIGRRIDNDLVIDSPRASRYHARIERSGSSFMLCDLNSDNGTFVRGERVTRHALKDGDVARIGDARLVFKAGFVEEELTIMEPRAGSRAVKRPVVVVPGFMGSNLWLGSERVWPNARQLFTNPDIYRYGTGAPALEPRGLVDEVVIVPNILKLERYGRLIHFLEEAVGYERGRDLLEFAYDFRQDLRVSARQLGAAIENWDIQGPVTIIAHSMGSLVSRYYVDRLGGHRRVERLVCLGGPQQGAPEAVMNLAAGGSLLPFGIMGARLRDVIMTYPAMFQLLPAYACSSDQAGAAIDWLSDARWLPETCGPLLHMAAEFRGELRPQPSVPTICIFGYSLKTVTGVRAQRNALGTCEKVTSIVEPAGDGTVPEKSATLGSAEIHPVQQYHGTLHVDNDVRKRLKIELTR